MVRGHRKLSPPACVAAPSFRLGHVFCINLRETSEKPSREPRDERRETSDLEWHGSTYYVTLCFHIDPPDGRSSLLILEPLNMAYHILIRILTFMRIPLVCRSSAQLDNILYHKNVPMSIQSLCSNGYLSLISRLIPHSNT